jgi:hypothetical protein
MRKMTTALVAAGLLFTAACGGDDDDSADGGGGGGGDSGGFCDEAVAVFNATDLDEDGIEQLRSIEPPGEIADDWQTMVEGMEAANAGDLDVNDPEAAAEFEEQYADLMEATTSVSEYLSTECGLNEVSPDDPSDLDTGESDSTDVTTEAGG